MKNRRILLALTALSLPMSALAQRPQPLEPVPIPPSIDQGVDMIYIDPEIAPSAGQDQELFRRLSFEEWTGAPLDLMMPVNQLYTDLRRGLVRYQMKWSNLPQLKVPAGAVLKPGVKDPRVALLRERLGLPAGESYDEALTKAVKQYQAAHGLEDDGIAGSGTLNSLNRGAKHYEQLIIVNMERARRLPPPDRFGKYILVDSAAARLYMYENGKVVDSMRIAVGTAETPTPMMAAELKYLSLNPYWNVPPELITNLIAPKVLAEGIGYLTYRHYEVLSDWTDDAKQVPLESIDWKAVADGKLEIRLRRGPSPGNSMGDMKFMMPNDFGIYLHDYPDKSLFAKEDRWISNGCVRLEDAHRLARWVFNGKDVKPQTNIPEEQVDVRGTIPVFMTYLTAAATSDGVVFRPDRYGRDANVLNRFFDQTTIASVADRSGAN